jgi:hypothetical protein
MENLAGVKERDGKTIDAILEVELDKAGIPSERWPEPLRCGEVAPCPPTNR